MNEDKWDSVISHMATTNAELKNMTEVMGELKEKVGKQNGRIAKLETWRAYILGAIGVSTFIIAIVIK